MTLRPAGDQHLPELVRLSRRDQEQEVSRLRNRVEKIANAPRVDCVATKDEE
jgi:hypothetical protein